MISPIWRFRIWVPLDHEIGTEGWLLHSITQYPKDQSSSRINSVACTLAITNHSNRRLGYAFYQHAFYQQLGQSTLSFQRLTAANHTESGSELPDNKEQHTGYMCPAQGRDAY